jgi:hypothetical protein
MEELYEMVKRFVEIDENDVWDMGEMFGLDVLGEMSEVELRSVVVEYENVEEVLERVLKNVREIRGEYVKEIERRSF